MRGLPLLLFILIFGGAIAYFVSQESQYEPHEEQVVTSFESCVAAGNPVMESYPRQCRHNDVTYVEDIENNIPTTSPGEDESIACKEEQRGAFCTQQYDPVCGLTQVECITTPCDPVPQTYGNACTACSNDRVISYTPGMCDVL